MFSFFKTCFPNFSQKYPRVITYVQIQKAYVVSISVKITPPHLVNILTFNYVHTFNFFFPFSETSIYVFEVFSCVFAYTFNQEQCFLTIFVQCLEIIIQISSATFLLQSNELTSTEKTNVPIIELLAKQIGLQIEIRKGVVSTVIVSISVSRIPGFCSSYMKKYICLILYSICHIMSLHILRLNDLQIVRNVFSTNVRFIRLTVENDRHVQLLLLTVPTVSPPSSIHSLSQFFLMLDCIKETLAAFETITTRFSEGMLSTK